MFLVSVCRLLQLVSVCRLLQLVPVCRLQYLQETLAEPVRQLLDSADDCEVDPARVQGSATQLQRQQQLLLKVCARFWERIQHSYTACPPSGAAHRLLLSVSVTTAVCLSITCGVLIFSGAVRGSVATKWEFAARVYRFSCWLRAHRPVFRVILINSPELFITESVSYF